MANEKELIIVAQNIKDIIAEIGTFRRQLEGKGQAKARAISNYDKRLGTAIIVLKEEAKFPATLIEKIAKKVCADDRYELELAESSYKSCISNIEALKAQLNAHQSIYRHLDEA